MTLLSGLLIVLPMQAVGIAWFRSAEDYKALVALFDDRDSFRLTFEEWLLKAEEARKNIAGQGHAVVRAYLDPIEFPIWCADRSLKIDSKARMRFANEVAAGRWG